MCNVYIVCNAPSSFDKYTGSVKHSKQRISCSISIKGLVSQDANTPFSTLATFLQLSECNGLVTLYMALNCLITLSFHYLKYCL